MRRERRRLQRIAFETQVKECSRTGAANLAMTEGLRAVSDMYMLTYDAHILSHYLSMCSTTSTYQLRKNIDQFRAVRALKRSGLLHRRRDNGRHLFQHFASHRALDRVSDVAAQRRRKAPALVDVRVVLRYDDRHVRCPGQLRQEEGAEPTRVPRHADIDPAPRGRRLSQELRR